MNLYISSHDCDHISARCQSNDEFVEIADSRPVLNHCWQASARYWPGALVFAGKDHDMIPKENMVDKRLQVFHVLYSFSCNFGVFSGKLTGPIIRPASALLSMN